MSGVIFATQPQRKTVSLSMSPLLSFIVHPHTPHTFKMFQNAWWPIYYWRGTPTDKQIPRNESSGQDVFTQTPLRDFTADVSL